MCSISFPREGKCGSNYPRKIDRSDPFSCSNEPILDTHYFDIFCFFFGRSGTAAVAGSSTSLPASPISASLSEPLLW